MIDTGANAIVAPQEDLKNILDQICAPDNCVYPEDGDDILT